MSDWSANGCPPPPQGTGEKNAGPEGTRRGIVPFRAPQNGSRPSLTLASGLFLCAIGGAAASTTLSVLAPALVAFGYFSAVVCGNRIGRIAALAASLVPAAALSASAGAGGLFAASACCLVAALVVELVLRGRMTPGAACLVVAASAVCHLGVDAALAAAEGTSITASVEALLDAYEQELGLSSASVMAAVRTVMGLLWPLAYVTAALCEFLVALFGAGLAVPRMAEPRVEMPRLADYDLPLWVVAVLVAGAAGVAFGLSAEGAVAETVLMASANVVMALRFALLAQGLAVLSWVARRHSVGTAASAFLGGVALYLEVQFVVLSLVGLVDVWANFRHLQRGTTPTGNDEARQ